MTTITRFAVICMWTGLAFSIAACGRSAFTMPTLTNNLAPPVRLAEFAHVELLPMTYLPAVTQTEEETVVVKIAAKISELTSMRTGPFLAQWNGDTQRPRTQGTLVIQPMIKQLKWVTRGERIWGGAMYGNSAIEVGLKMTDKATGNVVHEAMLFCRAGAMSGAWGTQEDALLNALADKILNYIVLNYESAFGGPTGVDASPDATTATAASVASTPAPVPAGSPTTESAPTSTLPSAAPSSEEPPPVPPVQSPPPPPIPAQATLPASGQVCSKDIECPGNQVCTDARCAEPVTNIEPGSKSAAPVEVKKAQTGVCADIDCSGHGTCIVKKGQPYCACFEGYQPDEYSLNCIK